MDSSLIYRTKDNLDSFLVLTICTKEKILVAILQYIDPHLVEKKDEDDG